MWVYVCLLLWFSLIVSGFCAGAMLHLVLCFCSITWNRVWWFIGFIGFLCFQINFSIFFYFYENGMGVLMEVVFNLYNASGNIAISQYWFLKPMSIESFFSLFLVSSSIPFFKYFKVFIVVAFYHLITFILRYFICSVCFSGSFEWDCFSDFFPSLLTIDIYIGRLHALYVYFAFVFEWA